MTIDSEIVVFGLFYIIMATGFALILKDMFKVMADVMRLVVEASKARDLYELRHIEDAKEELKQPEFVASENMDDEMFKDFLNRQLNKSEEDDTIN